MANTKHEDAILKMGFDYFRGTILKTLGIDYDFVEEGITELIELTIHALYMDFTFLTTGDFYIHIEFQTTDSGEKDLRRFHAYESVLSHKTGKNVITYVIYSGGIKDTVTQMNCGINTYQVIPVYLSDKDADAVLKRLHEKKQNGEIFTEEDFAQLALTPLMGSKKERKDVILESLNLSKTERSITAEKVMAMLYTLADKFLEEKDLEEVKEAVAMTRIGQMIYDDGVIRGREEGRIAGREEGRIAGREEGRIAGQKAGAERMSALTAKLLKEKRLEDLQRATEDEEFREKLMKEFGIL